jgi:hypothetical protein
MPTPASKVTDPEWKSPLDQVRAGIAATGPKLLALQAQVDAIDVKLANCQFGESSFRTGSTLLKTPSRDARRF